ncbi:hypothetical protein FXB40_41400 [Bradyrhizobium rifense]|uniref:Uncharacterized protein n=1 Tax=Bradyrhizobium rifense TaxID=515499 RepID=A0A5D3K7I7_9BRAD|nr:hypothetical protein FXB40_41400 [Bradyrhizobium rifense]
MILVVSGETLGARTGHPYPRLTPSARSPPRAITTHRASAMRKLGRTAELVRYAIARNRSHPEEGTQKE